MATLGNDGDPIEHRDKSEKSSVVSPLKIRQLLRDGFASEHNALNRPALSSDSLACTVVHDAPSEGTSKNAFFDRVESFSCLKWSGKPCVLSPLRCAQYGWINVDTDILKCSSCQTFLCASIQPTLDYKKYEGRVLELKIQLQTQHEKFCSWPDFPCPDWFWMVPVDEPEKLIKGFLERFRCACLLQQQLPIINPELFKSMALTEDVICSLLPLTEQKQNDFSLDQPNIQMAASILALCGWEASPGQYELNLPTLNCALCMRKVGLWNFHQLEGGLGDGDNFSYSQFSTLFPEGRIGDRLTSTSSSQSTTACRMKLRSQDNTRIEQSESTSSLPRTRSRDSPSPNEDIARGKRPLTRSRGHGDNLNAETPSSPQRKTKRPRLSFSSGPEGLLHRCLFDPIAQHRNWCPWVNAVNEQAGLESLLSKRCEMELPVSGWKATLGILLTKKRGPSPIRALSSQVPEDKSERVFSIFRK
ncbi:nuclear-interacting partner of ALK [Hoplias malabaricus]|uniref:nuclear-interacting partner of ALK n=1 Tax=Hoplias malabaricus TaxID=27720 RepID=UPI0034625CC1